MPVGQKAQAFLEFVGEDKVQAIQDAINKRTEKMSSKTDLLTRANKKYAKALGGVKTRWHEMTMGISSTLDIATRLLGVVQDIGMAAREGARSLAIESGFEKRFGEGATGRFTGATAGRVDETTAQRVATALNRAGVSAREIQRLMTLATQAAEETGRSTSEVLTGISQSVTSGEAGFLKQLGLAINTEKVIRDYAAGLGRSAESLDGMDRSAATLAGTVKILSKEFGNVKITGTALGDLESLETEWKDFMDRRRRDVLSMAQFVRAVSSPTGKGGLFDILAGSIKSIVNFTDVTLQAAEIIEKRAVPVTDNWISRLFDQAEAATKAAASSVRMKHAIAAEVAQRIRNRNSQLNRLTQLRLEAERLGELGIAADYARQRLALLASVSPPSFMGDMMRAAAERAAKGRGRGGGRGRKKKVDPRKEFERQANELVVQFTGISREIDAAVLAASDKAKEKAQEGINAQIDEHTESMLRMHRSVNDAARQSVLSAGQFGGELAAALANANDLIFTEVDRFGKMMRELKESGNPAPVAAAMRQGAPLLISAGQKMGAGFIKSQGPLAAWLGGFELAKGIAAAAIGNVPTSIQHFLASGIFFAKAAAAGAGGGGGGGAGRAPSGGGFTSPTPQVAPSDRADTPTPAIHINLEGPVFGDRQDVFRDLHDGISKHVLPFV